MLEKIETALQIILAFAPIITLAANLYVWRVFLADTSRPRNSILWVMASNGAIVVFASVLIAVIAFEVLLGIDLPSWWQLVFIPAILALYSIPIRHALTVNKLAATVEAAEGNEETQDQREDRQFGQERRKLEVQHNKDLTDQE